MLYATNWPLINFWLLVVALVMLAVTITLITRSISRRQRRTRRLVQGLLTRQDEDKDSVTPGGKS